MKIVAGLVAATVLALFAGSAAMAQTVEETNARLDQVFGEHESFGEVFDILYQAVDAGDAATVASLAKYPLRVATNGEEYEIDSEVEEQLTAIEDDFEFDLFQNFFVAQLSTDAPVEVESTIRVAVAGDSLHFFDLETAEAI